MHVYDGRLGQGVVCRGIPLWVPTPGRAPIKGCPHMEMASMVEIRDGLTTEMRYAIYALGREYGPDDGADHGADQRFYRILRKPPYEAFKAYEVMRREWGLDVIPLCPDRATILGDPCYPSLLAAPHP